MITNWIKQSIAGETPDIDPSAPLEERQMWRQYEGFATHYQPQWIAHDLTVTSSEYGYAETVDWLARIRGNRFGLVREWTVAGFLGGITARPYPETAMRLAAIAHELSEVDKCAVLVIRPRFSRLIPVDNLDEWFAAYLVWHKSGRPDWTTIQTLFYSQEHP